MENVPRQYGLPDLRMVRLTISPRRDKRIQPTEKAFWHCPSALAKSDPPLLSKTDPGIQI